MNRFIFTIRSLLQKRQALRAVALNTATVKNNILEITPQFLNENGIQILVLDFDGVLAPHNAPSLLPEVFSWLKQLEQTWPQAILIFSNKPTPEREVYFKTHFPRIGFLKDVARKPYPDGLLQLQETSHTKAAAILMVDDRLLTGTLAAVLAGCRAVWIRQPYQDFSTHPCKEAWFQFLRFLDRLVIL